MYVDHKFRMSSERIYIIETSKRLKIMIIKVAKLTSYNRMKHLG